MVFLVGQVVCLDGLVFFPRLVSGFDEWFAKKDR